MFKLILLASSFIAGSGMCMADFIPVPLAPHQGIITEKGAPGKLVAVTWTTNGGVALGTTPIMKIPASGVLNIPVPRRSPDKNGNLRTVYDYIQFSHDGPDNYLTLEAFVPSGSNFLQYSFIDYIATQLGPGGHIAVPDLYGDTNHDGKLDGGDVLYTAVNLADYIPANPSFNLGESFTMSGGISAQLPGMLFGTQPITLDASAPDGFSNPAPFTGDGIALTEHANTVVPEPEPGVVMLMISALTLAGKIFHIRSSK
jgi:hypothetical protein